MSLSGLSASSRLCKAQIFPMASFVRNHQYKGGMFYHPNPLTAPRPTKHEMKAKHYNPKFRKERTKKVIKVELPDFHEKRHDLTAAEIREKMKKMGMQPPRPWNERSIYIASSSATIEPYVPPEGDGKAGFLTKEGVKQKYDFLNKKGKSMLALRRIRKFEEEFDLHGFTEVAEKVYIDLHTALADFNEDRIHQLATEKVFPAVIEDAKNKQIRWTYLGPLEPPRVVQVRHAELLNKDNSFAQLTVRFHSQQLLAVYDRFGRLMHGSDVVARDVLEYVVFEKHISNVYGTWRIHDKIVPDWMKLKPASYVTFKKDDYYVESVENEKVAEAAGR